MPSYNFLRFACFLYIVYILAYDVPYYVFTVRTNYIYVDCAISSSVSNMVTGFILFSQNEDRKCNP